MILKRALDESSVVRSPTRLWHDRRNSMQWYTLWVAVLVAVLSVLSVCLSIVQVALSGVQLSMLSAAQPETAGTDRDTSPTSSLPSVPTVTASPGAKDDGGNHLSSGAIVGITFAAVGVCGAVVAMGIYSYRTHRKRVAARNMANFVDVDIVDLVDGGRFETKSRTAKNQTLEDPYAAPSY